MGLLNWSHATFATLVEFTMTLRELGMCDQIKIKSKINNGNYLKETWAMSRKNNWEDE